MGLHFTFRKLAPTDALKQHVEKKVEKFQKYVTYPIEIHVLLSVDKPYHTVEITCYAEHRQLVAIAKTHDLYAAIDLAEHKMEARLKKEREKKKGHKSAHLINRKPRALKLAKDVQANVPHLEKKLAKR